MYIDITWYREINRCIYDYYIILMFLDLANDTINVSTLTKNILKVSLRNAHLDNT